MRVAARGTWTPCRSSAGPSLPNPTPVTGCSAATLRPAPQTRLRYWSPRAVVRVSVVLEVVGSITDVMRCRSDVPPSARPIDSIANVTTPSPTIP